MQQFHPHARSLRIAVLENVARLAWIATALQAAVALARRGNLAGQVISLPITPRLSIPKAIPLR